MTSQFLLMSILKKALLKKGQTVIQIESEKSFRERVAIKKRSREHSLLFLFALSHVVTQSEREYNTFSRGCKRNFFRLIGAALC